MNWLERAQREIGGSIQSATANTAERALMAVTAVLTSAPLPKTAPSIDSNGSAPSCRIQKSGSPATTATASRPQGLFEFLRRVEPEAMEARACIISEGCGIEYAQALEEARWQAEREAAWSAFRRNGERILAAAAKDRDGLLQRYQTEAASRYGARVAKDMVATMRKWVAGKWQCFPAAK